ncbi:hypothetical protein Tco_0730014 [Tanacetum coccineum]|uniref:Uncharacterized protein n=1 Tax=Tanacetum coccineum TaxID=301880 RepID=A0ABQ4YTN3_9ASTR
MVFQKGSGFDLKAYSDSDYVGCNLDRKSTSGGCQILGGKLVYWSAKKQNSVAMSSAEAEYVGAVGCCAQVPLDQEGMIGSLMYLTASRPDIRFSTCLCASFDLKAYSDSDYAGCNLGRKSTSGGCQILGGKLICWSVKKQSSVAMSSSEAEYVAAAGC